MKRFTLQTILEARRNDPAAFSPAECLSWQNIFQWAERFHPLLSPRSPGPCGLVAPNGSAFVALLLAALETETPLVLFSPRSTAAELARHCDAYAVSRLFVAGELAESLGELAAAVEIVSIDPRGFAHPVRGKTAVCGSGNPGEGPRAALFQFTSGSTGRPKLAARSRASLAAEIKAARDLFSYKQDDVIWCPAPFFHAYGLVDGLLCAMDAGASLRFDPQTFTHKGYAALEKMDASVVVSTPPFWRGLLRDARNARFLPRLRRGLTAGAPLGRELADAFRQRFGFPLTNIYGMTELGTVLVSRPDDPPGKECHGFPLPGYRVRFVPSQGMMELAVRPPANDFSWLDPEARSTVMAGEYYRTGDCGEADDEGRIVLSGRISDFINVGGEKVAPADVVAPLATLPDLLEAVAFALDSPRFGQKVGLYVQVREGTEGKAEPIVRTLLETLPVHQRPSRIRLGHKPVPRTPTGKILRWVLQEWLEE